MNHAKIVIVLLASTVFSTVLFGQGALDPAKLLQQPTDTWPTYNGDYSGRRFSPLTKINDSNVKSLSLAWTYRVVVASAASGGGFGGTRIAATPLEVNGVLYFTVPNHVWAIDARTGQELWHYDWQTKGGNTIGNRGAAISGTTLYFETPDCNLVALNIADGKERWSTGICNMDLMNYGTVAPVIIKNHVMVGVSGDDLDIPGYVESHDPETGALQWRWYTHPNPGDPEAATWPNEEAMMHGGGMTWVPGTYDPDLNLYYFGTGNAQPVINGRARPGTNLYTACIIALNPDTGKLAWYFQPNPHDTHDWDAVQTPVLFDGEINGQKRKLVAQASRDGWFFVLDRTNGKAVVSTPYAKANWASGIDAKGSPIPNPDKMAQDNGALVAPAQSGAANWPPPSFDPATGLFYVDAADEYSIYYIFDDNPKPEGWAGNDRGGWTQAVLRALDYKTGKVRWSHEWPSSGAGRSGVLTTAGNLLFVGDPANNVVALNAATGAVLWHAGLGATVTNAPMTYELDGHQYVVVAAGDTLYGFTTW
jgi:acido-empty-quinoprotein group A